MTGSAHRPLAGRRIVTTRDAPGRLDAALTELGADVVHVPLIEIADAPDGGAALADALTGALRGSYDWVVVTSRHGAARVVDALAEAGAAAVRTAAVGTATAEVLATGTGRPVDLVPGVQRAAALVEAFAEAGAAQTGDGAPNRILVAQADRAEPTLVDGLRRLGHDVDVVTAYSTRLREPTTVEVEAALAADAVAFASGSAAEAWAATIGTRTPPAVCAIGPTTARAAAAHGIVVTAVADDHSVPGLVACLVEALDPPRSPSTSSTPRAGGP